MRTRAVKALLFTIVFAALTGLPRPSAAQEIPGRQYLTGTIVGVGGRFGGRTIPFTLTIEGYTTPAEVDRLNSALQSGGQDRLLDALDNMDKGRLSVANRVGIPVNAIIPSPTEEGTKLTIVYERTVSFFELRYGTRSQNYRFGYMELFMDRGGEGRGTMIPAAIIRWEDGTWEVENFGEYPARLVNVRTRRS
jgi:hypothetical protein